MAKKPVAKQQEVKSVPKKTVQRKRRNALERKCLSKALKRMLTGAPKSVFKLFLDAEKESRKKVSV